MAPNGQASIGPNLQGVGTATVDFWITTGRMPAVNVKAIEAERKPPVLTERAGPRRWPPTSTRWTPPSRPYPLRT